MRLHLPTPFSYSIVVRSKLTCGRRGAYCAAVVVSLLNLPTDLTPESPAWTPDHPTLFTKLPEYVQRCMYTQVPPRSALPQPTSVSG